MFRAASFGGQFALLVACHLYFLFFLIILIHLANKICSVLSDYYSRDIVIVTPIPLGIQWDLWNLNCSHFHVHLYCRPYTTLLNR